MIALEDVEIALMYLNQKKYNCCRLYLENIIKEELNDNKDYMEELK